MRARRCGNQPLDEGATFDDEALERAVEVTGGYPYFLQELGHAVWGRR